MAFLDEEQGSSVAEPPDADRRREGRPERRRQQYILRRLIGVGIGVLFLILVVLGFRGCLDARKERAMQNYSSDVRAIMSESQQRGEEFFDKFENGSEDGGDQALKTEILQLRDGSESLVDRADGLDPPGEMADAQQGLELSLRLRRDALSTIGNNLTAAAADAETSKPLNAIVTQMGKLYSSDVLYSDLAKPEIEEALAAEGLEAEPLPDGNFMPADNPEEWLDEARISQVLGSGGGETTTSGVQGLGLVSTTLGGVTLSPDILTTVADDSDEVEVQVQNQGESEASNVEVEISLGGEPARQSIESIAPGATESVTIPLSALPQPGTETTLEVTVSPVEGELDSSNNEASYPVIFG